MMNRRDAIKALMALPATTRITRASVAPGDVLVVECPGCISDGEAESIQRCVTLIWPDNKCLVLERGLTLRIIERNV